METKEERIGEEVISFEQIEDHSDPNSLNRDPNLSNLDINSSKDYSELDDDVFNENTKAKAEASMNTKSATGGSIMVTKSITGSTESHQAEALKKHLPLKLMISTCMMRRRRKPRRSMTRWRRSRRGRRRSRKGVGEERRRGQKGGVAAPEPARGGNGHALQGGKTRELTLKSCENSESLDYPKAIYP